jgi:hypothetical protein
VQGPSGATNVVVRRIDVTAAATAVTPATAPCHAGERATGGGGLLSGVFDTGTGANSGLMVRSYPSVGNSEGSADEGVVPTSWTVRFYNPTAAPHTLEVFAICSSP